MDMVFVRKEMIYLEQLRAAAGKSWKKKPSFWGIEEEEAESYILLKISLFCYSKVSNIAELLSADRQTAHFVCGSWSLSLASLSRICQNDKEDR